MAIAPQHWLIGAAIVLALAIVAAVAIVEVKKSNKSGFVPTAADVPAAAPLGLKMNARPPDIKHNGGFCVDRRPRGRR